MIGISSSAKPVMPNTSTPTPTLHQEVEKDGANKAVVVIPPTAMTHSMRFQSQRVGLNLGVAIEPVPLHQLHLNLASVQLPTRLTKL